jgi:putative membrane protein
MAMTKRSVFTITFLIGLGLLIGLLVWQGFGTIVELFALAGWRILLLPLFFIPNVILSSIGWWLLFRAGATPRFLTILRSMWIGFAMESLLPLGALGGKLVRIRMLMQRSVRGVDATASVVADTTVNGLALALVAVVGVSSLFFLKAQGQLVLWAIAGTAMFALLFAGILYLQHSGIIGYIARITAKRSGKAYVRVLAQSAEEIEVVLKSLYARVPRILVASLLKFTGHMVLAGEVWLALFLMGQPVSPLEAVVLRSLNLALMFAVVQLVPLGFGVQEGGYIALGALLGLPPDVMLAVSLATRARDLFIGAPALVSWQLSEGAAWRRADRATP